MMAPVIGPNNDDWKLYDPVGVVVGPFRGKTGKIVGRITTSYPVGHCIGDLLVDIGEGIVVLSRHALVKR